MEYLSSQLVELTVSKPGMSKSRQEHTMTPPRLVIVIGSTRPGRVGLPVAQWFRDAALEHGGFDVEDRKSVL